VPGRKTDVKDGAWIADLLQHGLLRASVVPDRDQRELRELTRDRTSRIQERTAAANRLPKTWEGANSKLASVATDILGVSGRQRLAARIAGQTDAIARAERAQGRLREKLPDLTHALVGNFGAHQRFMVEQQLAHIDFLNAAIDHVSGEIAERLRPCDEDSDRLDTIPGIGRHVAEARISEIGTDLARFPTAAPRASWAGRCPGHHASAGKRPSGTTRKGNRWWRRLLVPAAHAAARKPGTSRATQYRRLAARRGKSRAASAVGHSLLIIAYPMRRDETDYSDLGPDHFDRLDQDRIARRLIHRLENLGDKVTREPAPAA
jgi:transposase